MAIRAKRRSTRWSVLPALSVDGFLPGLECVIEGSVTAHVFESWLRTYLLPAMNAYPAPRSVLVMDNCSTHRRDEVKALCAEHGVLPLWLPPYSPDYNPIELTFHLLKQWMKRHRDEAPEYGEEDYGVKFEEFLQRACREFGEGVDFKQLYARCHVEAS